MKGSTATVELHNLRPKPIAPTTPEPLREDKITLIFRNTGKVDAVFHVYNRRNLDRIPHRYTIKAGKTLADDWRLDANGRAYDLWVYGPNGIVREFRGATLRATYAVPEVKLEYDRAIAIIRLRATNLGRGEATLVVRYDARKYEFVKGPNANYAGKSLGAGADPSTSKGALPQPPAGSSLRHLNPRCPYILDTADRGTLAA